MESFLGSQRVLGLYSLKAKEDKNVKFWKCWIYFLLILQFIILQIALYNHDSTFFSGASVFMKLNDLMKFMTTNVGQFAIIVETLANQKCIYTIFRKLENLEENSGLKVDWRILKLEFKKKLFIKMAILIVVLIAIEARLVCGIFNAHQWLQFYAVNFIASSTGRSRHLQLLYFMVLIDFYLSIISEKLRELKRESKRLLVSDEKSKLERLEAIKITYGLLWDVTSIINESFAWSEFMNITHDFIQVACDFYWMTTGVDADYVIGN
jgi:hypothetical protein